MPCPSAESPEANPHRTGEEWTLGTVREILANPACVGRMVWGRFRVDYELVDPTTTGLGHRRTRHRVSPDKWVISVTRPHPALVSEADFITVQSMRATRKFRLGGYSLGASGYVIVPSMCAGRRL
jgi:site-specific DNA recombinase